MKKTLIIVMMNLLMLSVGLAEEPKVVSACIDRELYLLSSNTSLGDLWRINTIEKMSIKKFTHEDKCYEKQNEINRLLVTVEGYFLVSGNGNFYWIDKETEIEDLITGKIHPLTANYYYSDNDFVDLPIKVNGIPFFSGMFHFSRGDLKEFDAKRKYDVLRHHFKEFEL